MILTVTVNPSIDRTVALGGPLERGGVVRAVSELAHPGGKGVNISRAAAAAGLATRAVLPAVATDPFVAELAELGVETVPVAPAGPMRVNLTVTEPDGTTTKINGAGAPVTATDLDRVSTTVESQARDAAWVVLAGSLPPGAPADWYAGLVARLRGSGVRVAVDTSEAPLAAVVAGAATAAPALLKPNAEELASLTGAEAAALEADSTATAAAARQLLARGIGAVLATLGGAGAVLVDAGGAWHAEPPPTRVVSTVGAGDASLFGYLLAELRGEAPAQRLATAVAYGSAAAALPGTTTPTPDDVRTDRVRLRTLDVPSRVTTIEGDRS